MIMLIMIVLMLLLFAVRVLKSPRTPVESGCAGPVAASTWARDTARTGPADCNGRPAECIYRGYPGQWECAGCRDCREAPERGVQSQELLQPRAKVV
jgi:hypothetical protein